MLCNISFGGQLQWRSFEYEGAVDAFGKVIDVANLGDTRSLGATAFRWFPPSEEMSPSGYQWLQRQREAAPAGVFHINDAQYYLNMHDKLKAFAIWRHSGIQVPDYFEFGPGEFYIARERHPMTPPFLLRMNNSVAGFDSWLIREEGQISAVLPELESRHAAYVKNGRGVGTRMFCSQFIDTRSPEHGNLNVSYRITVAGGKVVTGYARVSDPGDWVAVTNKFHKGIADAWLYYNKNCHAIMAQHQMMLAHAVESTGMNYQGLDVIQCAQTGQLYVLETQTTYDAGFVNAGPYRPPYYNPYNPELVKFLQENEPTIANELPLYHQAWLDKREHFRRCYANLKATMT